MPETEPQLIDEDGGVRPAGRRFDARDLEHFANYVWDEYRRRAILQERKDNELIWKEVDRQIALKGDDSHKRDGEGRLLPRRAWMPVHEDPFQAQALERAQKDARANMFPQTGPWFIGRGALTPKYEARVDLSKLNTGAEQVTQEVVNKITTAWHTEIHRRYQFRAHWDQLNGEAYKYGMFAGRVRPVRQPNLVPNEKGLIPKNKTFPALIPASFKNVYPDDMAYNVMQEGYVLGGAVIAYSRKRLVDLQLAAAKGISDPNDDLGGWMPAMLKGVKTEAKDGGVDVVEYEGDLIVPRKTTGSVWLPGVIVSVLHAGKDSPVIFRLRWRKESQSSWILHPYHREDVDSPYGKGLLMKAHSIQAASSKLMVVFLALSHLNLGPPIGYDRDDQFFETKGGPVIEPFAFWRTTGEVEIHQIGDPTMALNAYLALVEQYKELTGQTGSRAGGATRSHTTATAKQAELVRGEVPIAGYVDGVLEDPMVQFLQRELEISRRIMTEDMPAYFDDWGWSTLNRSMLPDSVFYEVFGAAGPLEQQQAKQDKAAAMQLVVQLDLLREQLQRPGQSVDINEIQRKLLIDAGIPEPDAIFESGNQQLLEATSGGLPISPGAATSAAPTDRLLAAE